MRHRFLTFIACMLVIGNAYSVNPKREFRCVWLTTVATIDWPDTCGTSKSVAKRQKQKMVDYMENHPEVGLLSPKVFYPNGEVQYLCKMLPSPIDLIGRRFLPQSWTQKRNERFELRQTGYDKEMNIPYLSGCFMLLRTEALKKVGLFDERFFMYPEDIDLTRRIHKEYKTIFYPEAKVIHNHKKASYKSRRYLWIHIVNMCRYFNKWGWLFDKERRLMNRLTLQSLTADSRTQSVSSCD